MEFILIIFIMGYIAQAVGNTVLVTKIYRQKKVAGLTEDTQIIFFIGSFVRLFWTGETRLSNFRIIWGEMIMSLLMSAYVLYLFRKYKFTQYSEKSNPFRWYYLTAGCLILAFVFHPGNKNDYYFTKQMFVSFTMYMEACGLLPQIYLIRQLGEIENMTGHYMFCLAVSRFLRLIFWILMFIKGDRFVYLIVADLIHTLLVADFTYYYLKTLRGESILLH